jgi:hypothetical protein
MSPRPTATTQRPPVLRHSRLSGARLRGAENGRASSDPVPSSSRTGTPAGDDPCRSRSRRRRRGRCRRPVGFEVGLDGLGRQVAGPQRPLPRGQEGAPKSLSTQRSYPFQGRCTRIELGAESPIFPARLPRCAPGRTRTHDPLLRRQPLYPPELRGHAAITLVVGTGPPDHCRACAAEVSGWYRAEGGRVG